MPPIITLLTDFGLSDTYVGQMKGAILAVNPQAVIVDLTHEVPAQQVRQGAFLLETAAAPFPAGTIHVAVVDPGVGSERRALAIETEHAWFVGPDNGLLSAALPAAARPAGDAPAPVPLPPGVRAVELRNRRLHRREVAATFHGRDIFGPVAAHLSLGTPLEQCGPAAGSMLAFPPFRAERLAGGGLRARVAAIDHFGNLITDARAEDLPPGAFTVTCQGHTLRGPVRTYADAAGPVALVGSAGFLEIAVPGGSAAALLGAQPGDEVRVGTERPAGDAG